MSGRIHRPSDTRPEPALRAGTRKAGEMFAAKRKSALILVTGAVLVAGALAACGDKGSSGTKQPSGAAAGAGCAPVAGDALVVLADDKHLQNADNVIAAIHT